MIFLPGIWLPILVSSVVVFIASSLVWTVLPHHRSDFRPLPNEGDIVGSLKRSHAGAGWYIFPLISDRKNISPEQMELMQKGPSGYVTIRQPGFAMGKPMILQFLYILCNGILVAYLGSHALRAGAPSLEVFRMTGTAAILAYCGALFPQSIWWGKPWSITVKDTIDGIVYGLLTAAVFGWLWPQ